MEVWGLAPWWEVLRLDLLGRLLLAALLGGLIGLEREISGKPAGLRTNILICVGATLLMEISVATAGLARPGQPADPARIAAQVVSGIGFIGAGTILVARGHVVGLTTAATLWVVAAIGLAVGARAYVPAVGTTVLVAVTLVLLRRIEDYLLRRRPVASVEVVLAPDALERVERALADAGLRVTPMRVERSEGATRVVFEVAGPAEARAAAWRRLAAEPGVRSLAVE